MSLGPTSLLFIDGADAKAFAHTQFTSDVKSLPAMHWQWSGWLDAQGRVRHFFALLHIRPDRLIAWLPLGGAPEMRVALERFVMRSKIALSTPPGWVLSALDTADAAQLLNASAVTEHAGGFALSLPGMPRRAAALLPSSDLSIDDAALEKWRQADIAAQLPLLSANLAGEFVPQSLDLERLDAIRFDKGCYPGQEVAARLHFRGGNKRNLQRIRINGSSVTPGSDIVAGSGKTAGRILYAARVSDQASEALAVVAVEHENDGDLRSVAGHRISIHDDSEMDVYT